MAPPNPLSAALLAAVRAQGFAATPDRWQGGAPLGVHPAIDLAVVAFPRSARQGGPVWANVLFSPEHPQGVAAVIGADAGPVQGVRFGCDERDAGGDSVLWQPGADWGGHAFTPLRPVDTRPDAAAAEEAQAADTPRFVAPYPASLLKLLVAVGLGLAVDEGRCGWPDAAAPMITVSDNDATDDCVALLHRAGWLDASPANRLNRTLAAHGLPTLQMNATTPQGGWRNADGAGVGQIHMTAWDTVRLLWLLDEAAPPAPWLPSAPHPGTPPLLQPATAARLRALLQAQQLDEVLSSGRLQDVPGWVPGLPDAPRFAHKTGTTDNYASDAGIVRAGPDGRGHCIVAVLTTLGRRYAPHQACATTWRLPALGAAVQALVDGIT